MTVECIISHHKNKQDSSRLIEENAYTKDCKLVIAEDENMGAAYNKAIKENALESIDGWLIFCKADFGFCGNIDLMTDKLKTNCIYGPSGFKIKLRKFHKGILRVGRFFQGDSNDIFQKVGKTILFPTKVIYLDHNCFIMHSSIIRKHNISFPEGLDDSEMLKVFCRNIRRHHIHSKAIPISCYKIT